MLSLVSFLLLALPQASAAPFWRWRADPPDWVHRIEWNGTVAMVVRPIPGTWRLLACTPDPKIPGLVVPLRGMQEFEVLDASRERVPRRVGLTLTQVHRMTEPTALLFDAPLDPKARLLAVLTHPVDRPWRLDAPEAPPALLTFDRDVLAPGAGAKGKFYASLAGSLGRRSSKAAGDAYAWLGEEFRAEVREHHGTGTLGAYLADVTGDPADRAAASAFAAAAAKADSVSRVYLSYLAATWGTKEKADFAPFFAAIRAERTDPTFDPAVLLALGDVGTYRVIPADEAAQLAAGFEQTPLLLFLLNFGYGPVATETLRKVYDMTSGLPPRTRLGFYQYIADEIGGDLVRLPPKGNYPIWYRDRIKNEAEVRAKLDAYFGLPVGKP